MKRMQSHGQSCLQMSSRFSWRAVTTSARLLELPIAGLRAACCGPDAHERVQDG